MRLIRLLGAVVLLYGLRYLFHALLKILGSILNVSASLFHQPVIGLNRCSGTVASVIGIGLLLAQNWARIAWLVAVTILVLEHCAILFLWYMRGNQNLTAQLMNVALTSCIALISWAK